MIPKEKSPEQVEMAISPQDPPQNESASLWCGRHFRRIASKPKVQMAAFLCMPLTFLAVLVTGIVLLIINRTSHPEKNNFKIAGACLIGASFGLLTCFGASAYLLKL